MAYDDIAGKDEFRGFLEAEEPLELKQSKRHLFDKPSRESRQDGRRKEKINVPRFFLDRWPFKKRKPEKKDGEYEEETEEESSSISEEVSVEYELSPSSEEISIDEEDKSVERYFSTQSDTELDQQSEEGT